MSHRYSVIRRYRCCEQVQQELYNPQDDTLTLINPKVVSELGGNGTFEFEIPRSHKFFGDINPLVDEIMVRDTFYGETIFVGRPISYEETDFKTAKVFCEGSMAYLHDILHRPSEWDGISPKSFFNSLITAYNTRKNEVFGSDFQKIYIGECTIPDRSLYRTAEWDEIYQLLEKGCVDSDGGYLMMSYDASGNSTLNWYKTLPDVAWQSAEVGSNLVNVQESIDLSDAATAFIPRGPKKKDSEGKTTEEYIMLSTNADSQVTSGQANDASFWKKHGYVEKLLDFNDDGITDADVLLHEMKRNSEYLSSLPWEKIGMECTVADLHYLNGNIPKFKLGQQINTNISRFRTISLDYTQNQKVYVTKITTRLDSAVPDIVIGTLQRQSVSDQFKKQKEDTERALEEANESKNPFDDWVDETGKNPFDELNDRVENLEDDYYGGSSSGSGGSLMDDIYIYLGTYDYEDSETTEPNPVEEGYGDASAEMTGDQSYDVSQINNGEMLEAVDMTAETTWSVYENSSTKITEIQGASQQVNISSPSGSGGSSGVLNWVIEFDVPVTVNGQADHVLASLEIPNEEMTRTEEGAEVKLIHKELTDGRVCTIEFELTYTMDNQLGTCYISAMRLVSTKVGKDTASINYRAVFKMPINNDGVEEIMELTIDIPSNEMTRDSAGTLLKKARKYSNGSACIINFKLTYTLNAAANKAYVTSMNLQSAYFGRENVTSRTKWSVWHD